MYCKVAAGNALFFDIVVELTTKRRFQSYSAFWNCQGLTQAENSLSGTDWHKYMCMEKGETAHYDQKKGWWSQDVGASRHRRGGGHSHTTCGPGIALGMTTQAYASTTVTAQWWAEQWHMGWCLGQALGAVNGVVGGLVGPVPQARGG